MDTKQVLKKLIKIAENQQKLIEKLAQELPQSTSAASAEADIAAEIKSAINARGRYVDAVTLQDWNSKNATVLIKLVVDYKSSKDERGSVKEKIRNLAWDICNKHQRGDAGILFV